jgi:hypothetical protein
MPFKIPISDSDHYEINVVTPAEEQTSIDDIRVKF